MTQTAKQATTIGEMAQEALAHECHTWRVLASVSGAIYLHSELGELLWITDRESALHARAIVIDEMPSPLPSVGSICQVGQLVLRFEDSWRVACGNGCVWLPDLRACPSHDLSLDPVCLENVLVATARLSRPTGGMALVLPFLDVADDGDRIEHGILSAAREAIDSCRQPLGDRDLLNIVRGCGGLIGLGSGLTPSGDDFLAAYLYTLKAHEIVSGCYSNTDWQGILTWLQHESERTNVISSTLLLDCAKGVAVAPLHDVVLAVLCEADTGELVARAHGVAGIGHFSGWDMLTGVHAAIASLEVKT